jgi:Fur family ferric uptake transcriptional regulator
VDELNRMDREGGRHSCEVTEGDHIRLACLRCGRIEEYCTSLFEGLKLDISNQTGFEIRLTRVDLGGVCRACAVRGSKGSG